MPSSIDLTGKWVHYLTRPFSLFGVSLWHEWYSSTELKQILSITEPDALFIEEHKGIIRHYRVHSQLEQYWKAGLTLVQRKPEKCKELLKIGVSLNKQAQKVLGKGKNDFPTLQAAVEFLTSIGIYATILPYLILKGIEELKIKNKELQSLAEKLRTISYYPLLIQEIIIPLAKDELHHLKVKNVERATKVITFSEICSGKIKQVPARLKLREEGNLFKYQVLDGKESIAWSKTNMKIVRQLENMLQGEIQEINGQGTYPGKAYGKAKIILSLSKESRYFNKGDILVTINSNPSLLPIIKKAAAIITDEGGLTCHAAIISRELKIPCIVGTKIATKVLQDGDMVEVDANTGIVKKI